MHIRTQYLKASGLNIISYSPFQTREENLFPDKPIGEEFITAESWIRISTLGASSEIQNWIFCQRKGELHFKL